MKLKPITAIIVLSLVIASLLVAGCTINLPGASTPAPEPTATPEASPSPLVTAIATPQPSGVLGVNATIALLTKTIKDGGNTIIEPFTTSTNAVGNTVFTCTFRTDTGTVTTEKVEMCKDSSMVGARFQATINDAIARGHSGELNGNWSGINSSSGRVITIGKLANNAVISLETE